MSIDINLDFCKTADYGLDFPRQLWNRKKLIHLGIKVSQGPLDIASISSCFNDFLVAHPIYMPFVFFSFLAHQCVFVH